MSKGVFFLNENGDLMYDPKGETDSSTPNIKEVWQEKVVAQSAETFMEFLREAKELGARHSRIKAVAHSCALTKVIPDAFDQLGI